MGTNLNETAVVFSGIGVVFITSTQEPLFIETGPPVTQVLFL